MAGSLSLSLCLSGWIKKKGRILGEILDGLLSPTINKNIIQWKNYIIQLYKFTTSLQLSEQLQPFWFIVIIYLHLFSKLPDRKRH